MAAGWFPPDVRRDEDEHYTVLDQRPYDTDEVGLTPGRALALDEYSMKGALVAPLRENLAAGFRYPYAPQHDPGERTIASAKVKLPTGEWVEL